MSTSDTKRVRAPRKTSLKSALKTILDLGLSAREIDLSTGKITLVPGDGAADTARAGNEWDEVK